MPLYYQLRTEKKKKHLYFNLWQMRNLRFTRKCDVNSEKNTDFTICFVWFKTGSHKLVLMPCEDTLTPRWQPLVSALKLHQSPSFPWKSAGSLTHKAFTYAVPSTSSTFPFTPFMQETSTESLRVMGTC